MSNSRIVPEPEFTVADDGLDLLSGSPRLNTRQGCLGVLPGQARAAVHGGLLASEASDRVELLRPERLGC